MTLRKTLIGALASTLLLFVGFAGQAVAQDDTGTDTTQTDTTDTTQTDTTDTTQTDTTDTTQTDTTDTTQTDTTDTTQTDTTDTTQTDTADTTQTDTADTTQTDTTADDGTEAAADTATTDGAAVDGQSGTGIADSFATQTPNPQPGSPAALADESTQAAPAAGDQVLGESQLAFTGPDTRVMALAAVLLGAGALFLVASRRQQESLLPIDSWLE